MATDGPKEPAACRATTVVELRAEDLQVGDVVWVEGHGDSPGAWAEVVAIIDQPDREQRVRIVTQRGRQARTLLLPRWDLLRVQNPPEPEASDGFQASPAPHLPRP